MRLSGPGRRFKARLEESGRLAQTVSGGSAASFSSTPFGSARSLMSGNGKASWLCVHEHRIAELRGMPAKQVRGIGQALSHVAHAMKQVDCLLGIGLHDEHRMVTLKQPMHPAQNGQLVALDVDFHQ